MDENIKNGDTSNITGANWTIKPENWTWDTKFKPIIRSEIPNYNTVDLPYFIDVLPSWCVVPKQQNGGEVVPKQCQSEFNRLNQSDANFVARLKDSNREIYRFHGDMVYDPNIGTKMPNFIDYGTHQLGWYTDNGKGRIAPSIYEDNGQLKYEPDWRKAAAHAEQTGDYFETTPEFAEWFTNNYKKYYPGF